MRAHHHVGPGGDARPERHQLQGVEPRIAGGDHRQADVRVGLRVAVTGEVLQRRQHAVLAQAADVGLDELRDGAWILPEGAGVDDRVERVVVEVGVGSEIDVDADRAAFSGRGGADGVSVPGVACRAHRHDLGKRGGPDDPHARPPLEVRRHEQRQAGAALQHVELGGDVERRPGEDDETAHLERVHPALRHHERGIVEGAVASGEPGHDDLGDFLAHGEPGEHRVDRRRNGKARSARPPDRLSAGAPDRQRHHEESMRAHHLSVLGLLLFCSAPAPGPAPVRPGIEVLLADSLHLIAGQRLGLLSNHTGVDRQGRRDADLLRTAPGARLTVLFGPEHGFRGLEDRPGLPDGLDSATGLPIYSLYGGSRLAARSALDSIDVLLIDLQDVGARYYTYPATAASLMRDAAGKGKRVIVLDRPDPIGGVSAQGNVGAAIGDPDSDFVGFLPVPMRHGMTLGELERLANDLLGLHADLVVVPAAGWRRGVYYDSTGMPWIKPSPNMPSLESAIHYPGTCLFEGTNLSVGRGTPMAFQMIGAPWLDPAALLRRLWEWGMGNGEWLAGVEIADTTFTPRGPTDGKYDGVALRGVRLRVTNRDRYDPTWTAVAPPAAVRATHADSFRFRPQSFDRLAAGPELREAVAAGRAAPPL